MPDKHNKKKYKQFAREQKRDRPHWWRAKSIRQSLLQYARKYGLADTPDRQVITDWLKGQEPLRCYYSRQPVDLFSMQIDHKQPVSRGGTNKLSNLCVSSAAMNRAKGNMTEKEFKALLRLITQWEDAGEALLRRLKQAWRY